MWRDLRLFKSAKRKVKLKNSKASAKIKLSTVITTMTITHRVIGLVSCSLNQRAKPVNANQAMAAKVRRLPLLNTVLAVSLAVCVCVPLLIHATNQLNTSFAITLVTAVIAIGISCFVSISKKVLYTLPSQAATGAQGSHQARSGLLHLDGRDLARCSYYLNVLWKARSSSAKPTSTVVPDVEINCVNCEVRIRVPLSCARNSLSPADSV